MVSKSSVQFFQWFELVSESSVQFFQWFEVVSVSSVSSWNWFLEGVGLLLRPFWIKWIFEKVYLEIGFAAPGGGLLLRPFFVHFLYHCDLCDQTFFRKGLPLNWICSSWGGVY